MPNYTRRILPSKIEDTFMDRAGLISIAAIHIQHFHEILFFGNLSPPAEKKAQYHLSKRQKMRGKGNKTAVDMSNALTCTPKP